MHSSRMRTARPCIDRSACMWGAGGGRSMTIPSFGGGGVVLTRGGVGEGGPIQGGSPPPDHVTYPMMHLVSPLPNMTE